MMDSRCQVTNDMCSIQWLLKFSVLIADIHNIFKAHRVLMALEKKDPEGA
jgi:hypothetical protein